MFYTADEAAKMTCDQRKRLGINRDGNPRPAAQAGMARAVRAQKRADADERNAGGSVLQLCGHKHGPMQVSRCDNVS